MTITEKRQKRGQLVEEMRALQKKADEEKRSMTAEESAKWDAIDAEQEKLRAEIETEEQEVSRRARLAELDQDVSASAGGRTRPNPGDGAGAGSATNVIRSLNSCQAYVDIYDEYLRGQLGVGEMRARLQQQLELRAETMQVGLFVKGGGLVMPQVMVEGLLKAVDDETFMLGLANVERLVMAESLGIGTLDSDPDDPEWTAELKTGTDTDIDLGRRELRPHPLAKRAKVSNTLLRRTAGGAGALVNGRLAYKFGIAFEKGCLTGNGVRRPLGVFVPSADGIPTTRDVSTGNTATELTGDGMIEAKYALKAPYWRNARWMLSRTAVKQIRKAKTDDGQYIWVPGLSTGQGDRILDIPFLVSEYVPATFTANQYVGILGDFKAGYTIAIALDMTVQVLDQLYAEANKTGFLGRMEADGAPVLPEAFVRLKLGAA
jgi:HK97 family phage major capsid protein